MSKGKTINQLIRVDETTGQEIIPMAVYDETVSSYVTRGILLDDLFNTLYSMLRDTDTRLAYTNSYMSAYVMELNAADRQLSDEIQKTNTNVSYNAASIIKLDNSVAYVMDNIGKDTEKLANLYSYAYSGIGGLNDTQAAQDAMLGAHGVAIQNIESAVSYSAAVNNIQSAILNTLYYKESNDAFNNYDDPDDDYVKPQS